MYCIVQEVQNKRQDLYGAYKEIEVYSFVIEGRRCYQYHYAGERFERPIKTAYKITLRESYRVDGKVKSKIWTLGTITYYNLIEYGYYECIERKLKCIANETGNSFDALYNLVEKKLDPIYERVKAEFEQTEEYITKQKNDAILKKYFADKEQFEKTYGGNTYEYCYDVFGTLRNPEYLEQLKESRSYYKNQRNNYNSSSYQDYFKGNYNSSSYQQNIKSNYDEDDKVKLKKCFKILAKHFHPDSPNGDTEVMQFINDKLKKEWDL